MKQEVGVGIRMGNTCKSMADSCQFMTKTTIIVTTNYCKVISLQLIKINGKKKKSERLKAKGEGGGRG